MFARFLQISLRNDSWLAILVCPLSTLPIPIPLQCDSKLLSRPLNIERALIVTNVRTLRIMRAFHDVCIRKRRIQIVFFILENSIARHQIFRADSLFDKMPNLEFIYQPRQFRIPVIKFHPLNLLIECNWTVDVWSPTELCKVVQRNIESIGEKTQVVF